MIKQQDVVAPFLDFVFCSHDSEESTLIISLCEKDDQRHTGIIISDIDLATLHVVPHKQYLVLIAVWQITYS